MVDDVGFNVEALVEIPRLLILLCTGRSLLVWPVAFAANAHADLEIGLLT